jgi:hypothetical protein
MDKKKLVDLIINSEGNTFVEDDRATLMSMPEAVLAKMTDNEEVDNVTAAEQKALDEEAEAKAKADKKKKAPAANTEDDEVDDAAPAKPLTVNEYLATNKDMPEDLKESLRAGQMALSAQKSRYIKIITANKKNTFKVELLQSKSLDELKGIAQLAAADQPKAPAEDFDYSGQGDLQDNAESKEEALDLPVLNFTTEKK